MITTSNSQRKVETLTRREILMKTKVYGIKMCCVAYVMHKGRHETTDGTELPDEKKSFGTLIVINILRFYETRGHERSGKKY